MTTKTHMVGYGFDLHSIDTDGSLNYHVFILLSDGTDRRRTIKVTETERTQVIAGVATDRALYETGKAFVALEAEVAKELGEEPLGMNRIAVFALADDLARLPKEEQ